MSAVSSVRTRGVWQVSFTDLDLQLFATFDRLEELNLRGRKVTDLGIVHLARMKKLRSLNLSETGVTSEGLTRISGLPDSAAIGLAELKRVDDGAIPHLLAHEAAREDRPEQAQASPTPDFKS